MSLMQRVVDGYPPMIEEIRAAFPFIAGRPILFAWGKLIYASPGAFVSPQKAAHEAIHGARQLAGLGVEAWWRRYIAEPEFRLGEEIPAHVAEYAFLCQISPGRGARRRALAQVAAALASPLYGRLISSERARRVILDGASAVSAELRDALDGRGAA